LFVSYASEDRDTVAQPLVSQLQAYRLKVWYDEIELRVGDSIRHTIDRGISLSMGWVIVLSPAYFIPNRWAEYELNSLTAMAVSLGRPIFPVWHQVSTDQVRQFSPNLTDKLALQTGRYTIDYIAHQIYSQFSATCRGA
jgi:hypothetical protein